MKRGQALVEFALILPVVLMLILGTIDLARAVWQVNQLAFAAREGTRYAIVHGSQSSDPSGPGSVRFTAPDQDTGVNAQILEHTTGIRNVTIAATWPDGSNDRNSRVRVIVTAPFVPMPSAWLLSGALTITLRGGSELVIQR